MCYNISMEKPTIQQKLKDLPALPGVYVMKNDAGTVIYVGKAKVLKNRVRQYFQYSRTASDKVSAMVARIADFEYILTNSEIDALMLEANLIKRYRPQYNVLLKDDKNYPYLRLQLKDSFPRFTVVRRLKNDGARYFGPYMGMSVKELLDLVHSAYPLRTCARNFAPGKNRGRACLDYHLGRCRAPCEYLISEEEYRTLLDGAIAFLSGQDEDTERVLTEKMQASAEKEEYESAIMYRDRLEVLRKLRQRKLTALDRFVSADVFAIASNGTQAAVSLLYVRDGKMTGARSFALSDASLHQEDTFRSFLMQFYTDKPSVPPEVVLGLELEDSGEISQYLSGLAGRKVRVYRPRQGTKRGLANMAIANAEEYLGKSLERMRRREEMTAGAVELLKEYLGLSVLPRRMECYDISNISGTDKVASMAVTTDGEADRQQYRRFRIRTVEGADDFASMKEVLLRRFARASAADPSFSTLPDLVVIDGGKGQLSAAAAALAESGYAHIPVVSLAERDEEIFTLTSAQPLRLPRANLALRLLQRIRDEAHRFAVTYHRTLRSGRLESELSKIPGIGAKKRAALLKEFKSLDSVRRATLQQLCKAEGISNVLAGNIISYFQNKDKAAASGDAKEKGTPEIGG